MKVWICKSRVGIMGLCLRDCIVLSEEKPRCCVHVTTWQEWEELKDGIKEEIINRLKVEDEKKK